MVPYPIDYQSHCCDLDPLLLGTTVYKGLRFLFISFNLASDHSTTSYQSTLYTKWKVFIVSSALKKSLLVRKRFYVMAAMGGNTGDARQASRGKTTGLQCDPERRSFGHAFTVLMMIPYPSLRVQDSMTLKFHRRLIHRPSNQQRNTIAERAWRTTVSFLFFSCTWCFDNELL